MNKYYKHITNKSDDDFINNKSKHDTENVYESMVSENVLKSMFGLNQKKSKKNKDKYIIDGGSVPLTNLKYEDPSQITVYTIKAGTFLYHGTTSKETFNPVNIKLGDDTLVAYFSPNKRLAADYIAGCALAPGETGYIHMFKVEVDIKRVLIISTYDKTKEWTMSFIDNKFCKGDQRLGGIGFFFKRSDIASFDNDLDNDNNGQNEKGKDIIYSSEFAICDLYYSHLAYVNTQRCVSFRKLSNEYSFQ
jgi:hypothetical protein